ncbi:MAG: hypothetical protein IVW36_07445 [Dehalococcoidia bacterium]|nr:hypothetical protein [Dehalococcoidia bacterium]
MRDMSCKALASGSGLSESEIRRVLNQRVRPRAPRRAMLTAFAVSYARGQLAVWNVADPRDHSAILAAYLEACVSRADRRCAGCRDVIRGRSVRARHCSERCESKAKKRKGMGGSVSTFEPRRARRADIRRRTQELAGAVLTQLIARVRCTAPVADIVESLSPIPRPR